MMASLVHLLDQLQHSSPVGLHEGLLRRKGKLVIGSDDSLRTKIIKWLHSDPESSHSRRELTMKRIKSLFHWKGLTKDVRPFVRQCQVCQAFKYDTAAHRGFLLRVRLRG